MTTTAFHVDRDKLEARMSRVFDAPADRLQQAYTDPRLIPLWWGPRQYSTRVDHMDVRIGGSWRYVQHDKDGKEFAFRGEYEEILPNRLTSTFEWEAMAGHIVTDTTLFDPLPDGKTRLTTISRFASLEDLDGMVGGGMEAGASESWDRLAELVEPKRQPEAPRAGA